MGRSIARSGSNVCEAKKAFPSRCVCVHKRVCACMQMVEKLGDHVQCSSWLWMLYREFDIALLDHTLRSTPHHTAPTSACARSVWGRRQVFHFFPDGEFMTNRILGTDVTCLALHVHLPRKSVAAGIRGGHLCKSRSSCGVSRNEFQDSL